MPYLLVLLREFLCNFTFKTKAMTLRGDGKKERDNHRTFLIDSIHCLSHFLHWLIF